MSTPIYPTDTTKKSSPSHTPYQETNPNNNSNHNPPINNKKEKNHKTSPPSQENTTPQNSNPSNPNNPHNPHNPSNPSNPHKTVTPPDPPPDPHPPLVPFLSLFRHRDPTDTALLALASTAALANGAAIPAFSEIFGHLLDELAGTHSLAEVGPRVSAWSGLLAAVGATTFVLSFMEVGLFMLAAERQIRRVRQRYLQVALRQDMAFFDAVTPGEIGSRLAGDTRLMQAGMGEKVGHVIHHGATCGFALAFGFVKCWPLALIVLSMMPLLAGSGAALGKVISRMSKQSQEAFAQAGTVATQAMENIRTVHAFNAVPWEMARFRAHLRKARKHGIRKNIFTGLTSGMVYFIIFSSYALAFWYCTRLIRDQRYTLGEIVACFFSVVIGSFAIGMMAPPMTDIATARGAAFRIFETLARQPAIRVEEDPHSKEENVRKVLPELQGRIRFKDVQFAYPSRPTQTIFASLNLDIPAGSSIALVGPSGTGKSSIVSLVQRFYDPQGGEILIDDIALPELPLRAWRGHVGVVSQEPSLFSGTIRENILAGRPDVTNEQLMDVCKQAYIHDTIMKLPSQYNTLVGSLGSQLSGGQKQRIAIARALLTKPKVLLLDEATSALDRRSEVIVQKAIDTLMASTQCTRVVVAHRLATIKDCDHIYVFDRVSTPAAGVEKDKEGMEDTEELKTISSTEIVEHGTYVELLEKGGVFAAMVHAQTKSDARRDRMEQTTAQTQPVQKIVETAKEIVAEQKKEEGEENDLLEETCEESSAKSMAPPQPKFSIPYLRIARLCRPEWWALSLGSLGALVGGAVYPFYAVIFSQMMTVLSQKQGAELEREGPFWAMLFLTIAGGSLFAHSFQFGFFGYAGEKLTERLRISLLRALLHAEVSFFDTPGHEPGALGAILAGDTESIHSLFGPAIGLRISMASTLACSLGIAFYYSWKLALVCMAMVPAVVVAGLANMAMVGSSYDSGDQDALEKAGTIAHESTANIRTVQAFNMYGWAHDKYAKCVAERERIGKRSALFAGGMFAFGQFVMFAAFAMSFWYGGKLISAGEKDFRAVMICSMAIVMGAMGMGENSALATKHKDAEGSARKVFGLIDRNQGLSEISGESAKEKEGTDKLLDSEESKIEFCNVHFAYPARPETPVLRGISFSIPRGKHLGIIGATGCGKSTIVQLLMRFYEPCLARGKGAQQAITESASKSDNLPDFSGRIQLKDCNLRELNRTWWREHIAMVNQEPALFEGSIRDNIAYGARENTDLSHVSLEEIQKAARIAQLHEEIMAMPEQYNTLVGTRGSKLSGGQKQRVAVARALIRHPSILVLDEATSALDSSSEAKVQQALEAARAELGLTVVTIAHRLTTVRSADWLIVLEQGVIIEQGTHEQLMARRGDYYERYVQYHTAPGTPQHK